MKFGGTSVADLDRIRNAARHVKRETDAGNQVAVVVSAMAGATNQLVEWVRGASLLHDAREYDAVVASGEQVTAGLMAIVLQSMGIAARSWQGWQIPILTDQAHGSARIVGIEAETVKARLKSGEVAVVTGFQGLERERNRIATLGRGGSDTSAVALAIALEAKVCDIYTDVDGVYTTDPRVCAKARRMARVSYEEMLAALDDGAMLVDGRNPEEFAAGHLQQAVNVGLNGRYAEFAGSVIHPEVDIVLVTEPGQELEGKNRLARIGFDRVIGFLEQPYKVMFQQRGDVQIASRLTAPAFSAARAEVPNLQIVDVRNPGEVEHGMVPGAITIPVGQLPSRTDELDPTLPTVVYCAGGYRSSVAASVLRQRGFSDVSDILGGYGALDLTDSVAPG